MKKLLITIVVIFAIAFGVFFYQREQVSAALQELSKGKTYSSYGIKIEIPSTETKIKGWFNPYLRIPKLTLNFSAWGIEGPISFENATASRKLWGDGEILLEVPQETASRSGFKILKPYAKLSLENRILVLGSEKLNYYYSSSGACLPEDAQNLIEISNPVWTLGLWQGALPDQTAWSWQGISFVELAAIADSAGEKPKHPDRLLWKMGPMRLSLNSEVKEKLRHFKVEWRQSGGEYIGYPDSTEIKGFEISKTGKILELDAAAQAQTRQDLTEIKNLWRGISKAPLDSKTPLEELDPDESFFHHLKVVQAKQALQKMLALASRLDFQLQEVKLRWDGLQTLTPEGKLKVAIAPLNIEQKNTYSPEGLSYEIRAQWEKIEFGEGQFDAMAVVFQGLTLSDKTFYRGLSYQDFFQDYLDHSFPSLSAIFMGRFGRFLLKPEQILTGALSYLAYYPSEKEFTFSIDKIEYQGESLSGKHQNNTFSYYFRPQEIGYELKSDFNIQKSDTPSYEAGKFSLAMDLKIPWEKLITLSRETMSHPEGFPDLKKQLTALFAGAEVRYDVAVKADLGKNYFDFIWDSQITLPLEKLFAQVKIPQDLAQSQKEHSGDDLMKALEKTWVEQGSLKVDVKIDRWTKFQEFFSTKNPKTMFGLVLLTPYGQIDTKTDTFQAKLEYKDQKAWVNGNLHENLNKLLEPFLNR